MLWPAKNAAGSHTNVSTAREHGGSRYGNHTNDVSRDSHQPTVRGPAEQKHSSGAVALGLAGRAAITRQPQPRIPGVWGYGADRSTVRTQLYHIRVYVAKDESFDVDRDEGLMLKLNARLRSTGTTYHTNADSDITQQQHPSQPAPLSHITCTGQRKPSI